MVLQKRNMIISGFLMLFAVEIALAVDITPFTSRGAVNLKFSYVPKVEQLGGLEVGFIVRPEAAVSVISLSPAQTGPWSQIKPELVQTGNAVLVSDITPAIMNCGDSITYPMFTIGIEFTDTAVTALSIDKIIDSMSVKQALDVTGDALQGVALTWDAVVAVRPEKTAGQTSQIAFRKISRSYMLSFNIAVESRVTASVYDGTGRVVARLLNKMLLPGIHDVRWGGTDASGKEAATGTYIIQLRIGNFTYNKKVSHVL